ncbi:mannitol-1-phosphate 5-dehydrogenase [Micropruina sonneratiae]|uniref:mannitol-1-phosphate 5-dehydrogenase n=1 Tax=Micropruina sonneratiae TaxID=2986940 RepID=UPI002225E481|nr:mannitol-1-phosphate 5-dehydrogenase [Micropruina sp. KQZ13P-5]MCW3156938.1 mannitol-1-phosphate 5-dehydrogenase [Micropruina sp. KQZ13P-5]
MKAVHFGAGNIGRGFVGLLLSNAGYELVFADVADALIDALAASDSYDVNEVGDDPRTTTVRGYSAINSAKQADELTAAIAEADIVTTAVGAHILKFVAPAVAAGIAARRDDAPKLAVMACENAINGTDILKGEVELNYSGDDLADRALFANTAVDRIVPAQDPNAGLDVTVENYFEWAIETPPFGGDVPDIPGVTWVEDLEPYIERKLFTVNTGHATAAWFGYAAGIEKISDALADSTVAGKVADALADTKSLIVAKHGVDDAVQSAYVSKILKRFANPHLPDTTLRVGRGPLRKLSRHDRFISPASQLAERGMPCDGLLAAIGAGLGFDTPDDPEAVELQRLLGELSPEDAVAQITGIEPGHPLYDRLLEVFRNR